MQRCHAKQEGSRLLTHQWPLLHPQLFQELPGLRIMCVMHSLVVCLVLATQDIVFEPRSCRNHYACSSSHWLAAWSTSSLLGALLLCSVTQPQYEWPALLHTALTASWWIISTLIESVMGLMTWQQEPQLQYLVLLDLGSSLQSGQGLSHSVGRALVTVWAGP